MDQRLPRAIVRLMPVVGCALVLLAPASASHASDTTARMHVTVAIPRHSTIVASSEPSCLDPSRSVDATSPLEASVAYRVRSTSATGIELVFEPASVVQSLTVRIVGETDAIAIPALGGSVTLRGHPSGETLIDVEYRISLDTAIEADCVSWPVRTDARPL